MSYKLVNAEQLDGDLTAVADSIREKTGDTSSLAFPSGFTSAIENIQQGSGDSGGGDDLFQYATFESGYLFYGVQFPENYEVKLKFAGKNPTFNYAFLASNVQKVSIESTVRLGRVATSNMFLNCSRLTAVKIVNDIFPIYSGGKTFGSCSSLKTIDGVIDLSQSVGHNGMFSGCKSLEDVKFAEQSIKLPISVSSSPDLSDASVDSIVNGLADLTGQTAQKLSVHPDILLKIADNAEWDNKITSKNWIYE